MIDTDTALAIASRLAFATPYRDERFVRSLRVRCSKHLPLTSNERRALDSIIWRYRQQILGVGRAGQLDEMVGVTNPRGIGTCKAVAT